MEQVKLETTKSEEHWIEKMALPLMFIFVNGFIEVYLFNTYVRRLSWDEQFFRIKKNYINYITIYMWLTLFNYVILIIGGYQLWKLIM